MGAIGRWRLVLYDALAITLISLLRAVEIREIPRALYKNCDTTGRDINMSHDAISQFSLPRIMKQVLGLSNFSQKHTLEIDSLTQNGNQSL